MTEGICEECKKNRYLSLHCEEQDDGSVVITTLPCKHRQSVQVLPDRAPVAAGSKKGA